MKSCYVEYEMENMTCLVGGHYKKTCKYQQLFL